MSGPLNIEVRISDNVLEKEDWGFTQLTIVDGKVALSEEKEPGAYRMPDMVGWTTKRLEEWSAYDPTGSHPETYHEVRSSASEPWICDAKISEDGVRARW